MQYQKPWTDAEMDKWKNMGGYYTYKNFQIHLIEAPDDDMPWELCEIIDGEYQGAIGHYDTLAEAMADGEWFVIRDAVKRDS